MFAPLKALVARLFGEAQAETSHLMHTSLKTSLEAILSDADRLIGRVEAEKAALQEEIAALTRQITQKDAEIEAARARAAHAYEVAQTLKEKL